jgi:hypothetical protein
MASHVPTTMAMTLDGPTRPRRWPGVVAWALWTLAMLSLPATVWLDRMLIEAGLPELARVLSRGNLTTTVAAVSAATVGALVASRRPRHRVGWLLVTLGLSLAAWGFTFSYTRYGLVARPGRCRLPATWPGSPTAASSSTSP